MSSNIKFSPAVAKKLGYYVYIYIDPRDGDVFYVGKGNGNRAFAHLAEKSEHDKVKRIHAIREAGLEPQIEFLVHGLDEETSFRMEAAVIDLFGKDDLSNKVGGYRSRTHGRMTIEQLRATYEQQEVKVDVPAILIRINSKYRHNMSPVELYDVTRHAWVVGDRAEKIKYAFSVYDGVVREVYQISAWMDAGSTFLNEEPQGAGREKKRKEFVGRVAPDDIRKRFLYKSVAAYFKQGQQNPITYAGDLD
jgi:uncharacterized protein